MTCLYIKHIPITKRCETSQSTPLRTQSPRWRPLWACARSPHLRLGNGSDTICNDLPPMTQYYPLLTIPNQTSQEVIHYGTTLVEARLTMEF
jgi:hypothetical protein